MNLDELQSVRDRERQTDKLQQLRESFYADAGEFIQQLRTERDRAAERADDPFDAPEVNRLTDEINTAEQTVEAIYEKRVGKVVKAASFAAADLPAEADGMTAEEQELFDTLVENIKENRSYVLDVLAGEDESSAGAPAAADPGQGAEPTNPPRAAESTPPQSDPRSETQTPPPAEPNAEGSQTGQASPQQGATDDDAGITAADVMGGNSESTQHNPASPSDVPPDEPVDTVSQETQTGSPAQHEETEPAAPGQQTEPAAPGQQTGTDPAGDQPTQISDTATAREQTETQPSDYPVRKDGGATTQTGIERETVRITESVETFVGSDERDYDLDQNDIVTLPATNAQILVERDAAEQID